MKRTRGNAKRSRTAATAWTLWLYIAGPQSKSATAFSNLKRICNEHLGGRYEIKVIDIAKNLQIARDDQILVVPMVVRKWPTPVLKIAGDMSNTARVLTGLHIPFA